MTRRFLLAARSAGLVLVFAITAGALFSYSGAEPTARAQTGQPKDKDKEKEKEKQEPKDKDKKDEPKKKTAPLPLKPDRTIEFTTDEGTWVSLDVSPDGKTIVFELLGDLYTVPIDGGEAKAITTGLAFDAQPRYSPDGKSIAFVSDRDGAENLWVAADGRLRGPAAFQGQAEPVRLAVVDARWRLRARLAAAAAPLGCLRALDVPRPRRLGSLDHQGQDQARRRPG